MEAGAEATLHATHSSKVTAREAVIVASHTRDQEVEEEAWVEGLATTVQVSVQIIKFRHIPSSLIFYFKFLGYDQVLCMM